MPPNTLRLGVLLPKILQNAEDTRHNISEGELAPRTAQSTSTSMELQMNASSVTATSATQTPAPMQAPVMMDPAATATATVTKVVSLEEVLGAGIRIEGPGAKTLGERALDAATVATGVTVGLGVAFGLASLGQLVLGLFADETTPTV